MNCILHSVMHKFSCSTNNDINININIKLNKGLNQWSSGCSSSNSFCFRSTQEVLFDLYVAQQNSILKLHWKTHTNLTKFLTLFPNVYMSELCTHQHNGYTINSWTSIWSIEFRNIMLKWNGSIIMKISSNITL